MVSRFTGIICCNIYVRFFYFYFYFMGGGMCLFEAGAS